MLKNLSNFTNDTILKRFICFKGTLKMISIENIYSTYTQTIYVIRHPCPTGPSPHAKINAQLRIEQFMSFQTPQKKILSLSRSKNLNLKMGEMSGCPYTQSFLKINNNRSQDLELEAFYELLNQCSFDF